MVMETLNDSGGCRGPPPWFELASEKVCVFIAAVPITKLFAKIKCEKLFEK